MHKSLGVSNIFRNAFGFVEIFVICRGLQDLFFLGGGAILCLVLEVIVGPAIAPRRYEDPGLRGCCWSSQRVYSESGGV